MVKTTNCLLADNELVCCRHVLGVPDLFRQIVTLIMLAATQPRCHDGSSPQSHEAADAKRGRASV